MSIRGQQIRTLAARTRARYETELGGAAPFPLHVADLAERVYELSAFPDPSLDARINGELNPLHQTIRLKPGMDTGRTRFIIAHELGHYVVEGAAAILQDDEATINERAGGVDETDGGVLRVYNTRERQEQDANLFALELLLPADALWQIVQHPDWTIDDISAAFGVSLDAARTQLLNVCCYEPLIEQKVVETGANSFVADSEQQTAVTAPLPTLVEAGPGTGKTRSIVAKYVALVENGADPATILALTFGNKAAEEMRTRIVTALSRTRPELVGRVEVTTFHAWGLNFLKSYGTHVGLPLDFKLRSGGDLFVLLKRHLADLPLNNYKMLHDPGLHLRSIMSAISRAKDELRTPADYRALAEAEAARLRAAADELEANGKKTKENEKKCAQLRRNAARLHELAAIYEQYEAVLRDEHAVDYGDLIMQSVRALEQPEIAREVYEKYQYILVDEFQDINYASGKLVALLDGGRGRVWAVGDAWQSIYRFRGASAANLAEFHNVYPGTTSVALVRNYRSVQGVLDASHALMQDDPLHNIRATQQAQRPQWHTCVVVEWEAEDQATEYAGIAHDMLRRVGGKPFRAALCAQQRGTRVRCVRSLGPRRTRRARWSDHAILCRTHGQVAAIVETLEAHGIPVDGGGELLDYPEVKDALAICALARSINNVGLLRALTLPEFKLSADDLELLVANAVAEHRSLQRATRDATVVADLSPEGQATLARLYDLHDDLAREKDAWRALTRYLLDHSHRMRERIIRAVQDDAVARRELANLGQLVLLARNFVQGAPPAERQANDFIAYVHVLIEAGEAPKAVPLADGANAVRVMTIHAAKGLEFRAVYVPGLQKDVFPPRKRGSVIPEIDDLVHGPLGDEMQEERYLLYVAMTRAQDRLVLSRATQKKDKAVERSALLPRDAPWPVHNIRAARTCRVPSGETRLRSAPTEQSIVAASSIETYQKCPRRYLYQYGFHLYDDATPFLRMHQTIHDVIDHLTELAQAGTLPEDEATVQQMLRQVFARHDLTDALYVGDFFSEAWEQVRRVWEDFRTNANLAATTNQHLIVERPVGRVSVRVDRVEQTATGAKFVQFRSGKQGNDDHLSTRIMLYTLAAQAHAPGATLAIQYTATGETRVIEHRKTVLENHTARIDAVLEGIAVGRWEPTYEDHCKTCPFNLICPV